MAGTEKVMSADRLAALLAEVPPGWKVQPNAVGNLKLLDERGEYGGFIDFFNEEVVVFDNSVDGVRDAAD